MPQFSQTGAWSPPTGGVWAYLTVPSTWFWDRLLYDFTPAMAGVLLPLPRVSTTARTRPATTARLTAPITAPRVVRWRRSARWASLRIWAARSRRRCASALLTMHPTSSPVGARHRSPRCLSSLGVYLTGDL